MKIRTKALPVTLGLALAMSAALVGCGSGSSSPTATGKGGSTDIIKISHYVGGAPSLVSMGFDLLAENPKIQTDHHIKIESKPYTSLDALYTDLARGRVQVGAAGPSTVASMAAQGSPVAIAGTIARATNAILSTGKGWSAQDLKGSRLVAQTSSSSWKSVQASIEDSMGLKAGKDYEVVNSDSNRCCRAAGGQWQGRLRTRACRADPRGPEAVPQHEGRRPPRSWA